jgi:hypothetical protein
LRGAAFFALAAAGAAGVVALAVGAAVSPEAVAVAPCATWANCVWSRFHHVAGLTAAAAARVSSAAAADG